MSVLGLEVQWTVGGIEEDDALGKVSVAFERAGAELAQFGRYAFPKLQPVLEAQLRKQFEAEGQGPISGTWAALSARYEAWKSGAYPGMPIMVASGAMKAGLTEDGSPYAERSYSDSMFNFGTRGVPYASYHQTGTGRMPARPPFDFGPELEGELVRAGMEGVREALAAAGVDEVAAIGEDL